MHFLGQVLFDMHQDEQEFVLHRWQWRILIRGVATVETWGPVNRVVAHARLEGRLERRQHGRKLIRHQRRERTQACRIVGDSVITKDRRFLSLQSFLQSLINHDKVSGYLVENFEPILDADHYLNYDHRSLRAATINERVDQAYPLHPYISIDVVSASEKEWIKVALFVVTDIVSKTTVADVMDCIYAVEGVGAAANFNYFAAIMSPDRKVFGALS